MSKYKQNLIEGWQTTALTQEWTVPHGNEFCLYHRQETQNHTARHHASRTNLRKPVITATNYI